jgi:putative component of toxin-antitoxin plasmid stabilization module
MMVEIRKTEGFARWMDGLRDKRTQAADIRMAIRLARNL